MGLRDYLHTAADAVADALEASPRDPVDALIPLSAAGLRPYGVELKPAVRLADEGTLRTVEIGRRRFTTLRHLLALVDLLPPAKAPEAEDDVAAAARKRARRSA
ncbi:MAG TPA: hypothetical protein VGG39_26795 [Polyangiaceae bacterium]|jgi:hypothetical protein